VEDDISGLIVFPSPEYRNVAEAVGISLRWSMAATSRQNAKSSNAIVEAGSSTNHFQIKPRDSHHLEPRADVYQPVSGGQ
jgi:hypothetical protein